MRYFLFVCFSFFSCLFLSASGRLIFHTIDVQSGLSDNFVHAITQDRYGFMWFATSNGVNRYDGYYVKRYSMSDLGAYNDEVEEIAEDKGGILWLRSSAGYCFYNREEDRMDSCLSFLTDLLGVNGEVEQLFVDEDGQLWCVAGGFLFCYDYDAGCLHKVILPLDEVVLTLAAREGQGYVLSDKGVIRRVDFSLGCVVEVTEVVLPEYDHHVMYIDCDLNLWVYTKHSPEDSIWFFDTVAGVWSYPFAGYDFTGAYTVCLTDDGRGNVWVGTDNRGVFVYDRAKGGLLQLTKDKGDVYSLPDAHIRCFYKDDRNNMWVGTSKRGVAFTNPDRTTFEPYGEIVQEDVSAVLEDEEGCLWVGSDGGGLVRFDPVTGRSSFYAEGPDGLSSGNVVCLFRDSSGRLWVGTYGGGVCYFEGGRFHRLGYPVEEGVADPLQYVRCITEDVYGNIWIGTIVQGLFCYDVRGEFSAYTMDNSVLRTGSITDLVCDDRVLYVATSSGLYRMDVQKRHFDVVAGSEDIIVTGMCCDSRGLLWIGDEQGVNLYDGKGNGIVRLSEDKGWPVVKVRGIVEDGYKNLWISTDLGITNVIVVADPELPSPEFRCYQYGERDGMGRQAFNMHALYCTRQGEVLAGGTNGLVKVNPKMVRSLHYTPRVVFTGLYWSNQRVETGEALPDGRVLLDRNILLSEGIRVDYSDNFALEVSAMNYDTQHASFFLYRLGSGDEWVRLADNRIYFNKLSPGRHVVEVKMANGNGDWGGVPASLVIEVRPPFWLSVPAYVVYFLLLLGVGVYVVWNMRRRHRVSMELQRAEMERSKRAEMEEAKLRFFTNISHDLRTPLSLIITPLEKLLSVPDVEFRQDMELMHRNARLLMSQVSQLLDFRKLENGKGELHVSYGNFCEFVKEVCGDFDSFSLRKGVELVLRVKSPVLNFNFDRGKMRQIFMNLLSNAFKYNVEKGEVVVTVDQVLGTDGPLARVQVADTGIGIRDENKERVFDRFFQEAHASEYMGSGIGLHIVKEYVVLHGGEIRVEDNVPQGTVFVLTFPLGDLQEERLEFSMEDVPEADVVGDDEEGTCVLVVEDNEDFRAFLVSSLKGFYRIYEARDGREALHVLGRRRVDVVISDVMMPVMDGLKLCNRIKNDIRFSHIPVILLTARSGEEHVVSGLKEGADDYITKPFNLNILLLRVNKLLEWKQESHKRFSTVEVSPGEITISSLDEQLIEKCIDVVEANMDNMDFSVEDLSSAVGMSRGYLYKKLMSITGKSPLDFISTLRIKRGHQLLEKSQLSISEIAYQIGLSPKQFSKRFKDEYGCLPSEFRKG